MGKQTAQTKEVYFRENDEQKKNNSKEN